MTTIEEIAQHNEDQIVLLVRIQDIDNKFDYMKEQRGNLPQMIKELEVKIEETLSKKNLTEERIQDHEKAIETQREKYKRAKQNMKQYEKEQKEVSNDQEYKSITRELELQKLDVLLAQKRIKQHKNTITTETERIQEIDDKIDQQRKILTEKRKTLEEIDIANKVELQDLNKKRTEITQKLDIPLYKMYTDRREKLGRALTNVVNEACNSCFVVIPTQIQIEIKMREKIMFCENCSRILAYVETPQAITQSKANHRYNNLHQK